MEKRGSIQNKYLIKAYLKQIYYESSNSITYQSFYLSHIIWDWSLKKEYWERNLEELKK